MIELIILGFESEFIHTGFQFLVVVLSLASSDDLSDSRNKAVHSCNGLAVVIQFHVECFDLLRIICNEYRFLKDLLCQIALMLCLKVASPEYFVVEFVVVFLKKLNCFCVGYMTEFGIYYVVQTIQKSLVDEGIEEVHLFRSVLQVHNGSRI